MVINEKALISQMKEAYKGGGYTVAVNGEWTYLTNGFWLAAISEGNIPDKIMGMFGEHIHKIPVDGDAFKVTKIKGGTMAQHQILDDVLKPVKEMLTLRLEANGRTNKMGRTVLTFDGWTIWQSAFNLQLVLIDPRFEALFKDLGAVTKIGAGLYAEGDASKLWVMPVVNKGASMQLEHLEQIQWLTQK